MDLHEYQKRIANFIAQHPHAILSVDMGLGKTAAVLAWLKWYYERNPETRTLIVAPKRVAENNWRQEAEKWSWRDLADNMVICKGTPQKRADALKNGLKIKIISRDNIEDVKNANFDVLILDELTSFKNIDAKRTKAVTRINAKYKIGLTGTFLANGAIDIYGQAAAVGLRFQESNFYAWRATYFRDILQGSGLAFHKWRPIMPLEGILKPIQANIFTLTAEDYLQIPEQTHNTHKIDVGTEIRKQIGELDAFLSTEIGGEVLTLEENQKFAKLQTLCNGFVYSPETGEPLRSSSSEKLKAVADFVADCKDAGEHVLLFYAFREEAAWLAELLQARGIKWYSVKQADFMQKWNDGDIDCLMAHPASAGHGLNLQYGGRIIVWSTLTYNFELFAQGNARLARQGQRQNVQIHYFVAEKTCEEKAVAALIMKQQEQNNFLKITKQ